MRFALVALLFVGCGFQPVTEGRSSGQSGDQLGGGNGPSDPGGKGTDSGTGPSGSAGDPNEPGKPGADPGTGTGGSAGDPLECKLLEEKAIYCKEHNLDCVEVFKELELCYAPNPQPANDCDVLGSLYKSCIGAHPNDPFCDEILAAYDQCQAVPPPGTK